MHFACCGDIEQVLARHNHLEIVLAPMTAVVRRNAFVTLHSAVYVRWGADLASTSKSDRECGSPGNWIIALGCSADHRLLFLL